MRDSHTYRSRRFKSLCEKLIEAIEKFLKLSNKEKKAMGLAARAKVEREFDRQIVVEAYMKEIKDRYVRQKTV